MPDLRVLQLNMWMSGAMVPDGVARLAGAVRDTGAEAVTACEILPDALEKVRAALAKASGQTWYALGDETRNGILSRWPLTKVARDDSWFLATTAHPRRKVALCAVHLEWEYYGAFLPRGYGAGALAAPKVLTDTAPGVTAWARLPRGPVVDDQALTWVNQASGRPQVVAALAARMREMERAGVPVVMGGDFNEPSDLDWTWATASLMDHNGSVHAWGSSRALREAGFSDAFREAWPDPVARPGLTWPALAPDAAMASLNWSPLADGRDRLDFVFHDPASTVLESVRVVGPRQSVCRGAGVDDIDADSFLSTATRWPSDHRGVLVDLSLRT